MALPTDNLLALFRSIVDIESVSHYERELADAIETTLRGCAHLELIRDGDAVMARTDPAKKGADGISAFLVERDTPGLWVGPPDVKMGQRGAHTADVVFATPPF